MKTLREAANDYLQLRRGIGFKMVRYESRLRVLLSFMSKHRATTITTQLALQFATHDPRLTPRTMSMRLSIARGFARYRVVEDPATEIPACALLPATSKPAQPYLYSKEEIVRLLRAARGYPSSKQAPRHWQHCRSRLWYCFFALLAVTGMRVGEVRHLRDGDIDWQAGVLTIRQAKFGKSRLVPLHRSMVRTLRTYLRHRDQHCAQGRLPIAPQRTFITRRGTEIGSSTVNAVFLNISRQIGLRESTQRHGPRLHDLRHRYFRRFGGLRFG